MSEQQHRRKHDRVEVDFEVVDDRYALTMSEIKELKALANASRTVKLLYVWAGGFVAAVASLFGLLKLLGIELKH